MLLNQTGVGRKASHGSAHFTNHPSRPDAARELERLGVILDIVNPVVIRTTVAQELPHLSSTQF